MIYWPRIIDISGKIQKKSLLLLGPRQTGKSALIQHQLPPSTPVFSFLDKDLFFRVASDLTYIRQQLRANSPKDRLVVIDEVQKLPEVLDEVHLMMEQDNLRFLLTGSSARKLKSPGINLLGGRARELILHPFVTCEIPSEQFDLRKALNRGLLPSIYLSDDPRADQRAYIGSYLETEIATEALVRDLPAFSRFLTVAALSNGQIINYSSIGNDAHVNRKVVAEYFEILFDTLLAFELPAWRQTKKRKPIETSKFYFFDTGVVRAILDLPPVKEKSKDFGDYFEAYIFHELRSYIDYKAPGTALHYWRSTTHDEVDFILGNQVAIEVKAKTLVGHKDLDGLRRCAEEGLLKKYIVVSLEEKARRIDDTILILPYREFLDLLWQDLLLEPYEEI